MALNEDDCRYIDEIKNDFLEAFDAIDRAIAMASMESQTFYAGCALHAILMQDNGTLDFRGAAKLAFKIAGHMSEFGGLTSKEMRELEL
jgi:hypothetical protein